MNLKISKPQDAPLAERYDEVVKPPKIAEVCSRLGLSYPNVKRAVYDPKLALDFGISRKHCFHDYHMRDIADPLSPFQDWALDMHVTRHKRESLWLNVITLGLKKIKPVVQTRGAKRMKHAFAEALKRKGYDRAGNPLSRTEAEKAGTQPASKGLYGTVRVRIFELKKFCAVPYAQVVEFWVRHIERRIQRELGIGSPSQGHGEIAIRKVGTGGGRGANPDQTGRIGREQKAAPQGERAQGSTRDSDSKARAPRPARPNGPSPPRVVSFI